MINKFGISYYLIIVIVALIFALSLVFLIPSDGILDRFNYLELLTAGRDSVFFEKTNNFLTVLFNEPIWFALNYILSNYFEPSTSLDIIIFFSAFTTVYLLLKNNTSNFIFTLVILLSPQILKNNVVHIRQGLAISFFLLGFFSRQKINFFYLLSCLIHSSFFVVCTFILLTSIFEKFKLSVIIQLFIILLLSISANFLLLSKGSMIDARQFNAYENKDVELSGLAFIYWTFILILYLNDSLLFKKRNMWLIGLLIFYLATQFFIPYSPRIFESALPIFLFSGSELTSLRRILFRSSYFFYVLFLYYMLSSAPFFGWGI